MSNNTHRRDLVDVRTGNRYDQPTPGGSVPPSQRPRSWEDLTASGRVLRPAGGAR